MVTLDRSTANFALAGCGCSLSPAQVNSTDGNPQIGRASPRAMLTAPVAAISGFPGTTFWAGIGLLWVSLVLGVLGYGGGTAEAEALPLVLNLRE